MPTISSKIECNETTHVFREMLILYGKGDFQPFCTGSWGVLTEKVRLGNISRILFSSWKTGTVYISVNYVRTFITSFSAFSAICILC